MTFLAKKFAAVMRTFHREPRRAYGSEFLGMARSGTIPDDPYKRDHEKR